MKLTIENGDNITFAISILQHIQDYDGEIVDVD